MSEKPSNTTPMERVRAGLLQEAASFREAAAALVATVTTATPRHVADSINLRLPPIEDADALLRVAVWREAQASLLRGVDDPLTITNSRGDPVERRDAALAAAMRVGGVVTR